MRIEIIYMDRTKDAEEYECAYTSESDTRLVLSDVTYPFQARSASFSLNNIDYYVEYEEEE